VAVEGFAVEASDGLVFTVKGLVHPPDRLVAYLRYVPDPSGERERGDRRYRRVYRFADQLEALEALGERGRSYLVRDPMAGVVLQSVPRDEVRRVYDPCLRLRELAGEGPADAVEEGALGLAELLRDAAGVPRPALGLTGSLLLGLHTPASDIDLVVYGAEACRAVHGALGTLLDEPSSAVRRPESGELAAIHAAHGEETPLSAQQFARLQAAKVNEGRYAARSFFVRFVKRPGEVAERYGDPRYEPLGAALVEARVADAADALFTPCRYVLEDAAVVQGPGQHAAAELREIVSFRGRFAGQARAGEHVRARGTLERVVPRASAPFRRLVVGAAGDYLVSGPD
jgi:predicted nucleotidyltransferase